MSLLNRREFLEDSAIAALLAGAGLLDNRVRAADEAKVVKKGEANDRVRIACIGVNSQGAGHVRHYSGNDLPRGSDVRCKLDRHGRWNLRQRLHHFPVPHQVHKPPHGVIFGEIVRNPGSAEQIANLLVRPDPNCQHGLRQTSVLLAISSDQPFKIQALLHLQADLDKAAVKATLQDPAAQRLTTGTLQVEIKRGAKVELSIEMP